MNVVENIGAAGFTTLLGTKTYQRIKFRYQAEFIPSIMLVGQILFAIMFYALKSLHLLCLCPLRAV